MTRSGRAQAQALWRLSDQAKEEARKLRERAMQLDAEAARLADIAAAVADGRPLEEAFP